MIKLHFLYRAVIDILYTNICETCNKVTPNQNSPICYACIASMPKSNFKSISNNAIKEKLYDIPNLQYCVSIYKYQKGESELKFIIIWIFFTVFHSLVCCIFYLLAKREKYNIL